MTPIEFPEVNIHFKPPPDLEEAQCRTVPAYRGIVTGGSVDGSIVVVVAYQPTPEDRERLATGGPIYLSVMGGLPPHFLSTSFQEATHPA